MSRLAAGLLVALAVGLTLAAAPASGEHAPGFAEQSESPLTQDGAGDFGDSLAAAGGLLAVGDDDAEVGEPHNGSLTLYEHDGEEWSSPVTFDGGDLGGSSTLTTESFGEAVDLEPSNATDEFHRVVVGDPDGHARGQLKTAQGLAVVYQQNTSQSPASWNVKATLWVDDVKTHDFGISVAVTGDWIFVGDDGFDGSGAVFAFNETGEANWTHQATFTAPDAEEFGRSIAADRDRLVVGAPGGETGAVYVFENTTRSDPGDQPWTLDRRLPTPAGAEKLGSSVDLDGDRIAVGDWRAGENGQAFVYEPTAQGHEIVAELTASNAGRLGGAVAIDGTSLAVGDTRAGAGGSAFVYGENSTGAWVFQGEASLTGSGAMGSSVALHAGELITGAPLAGPDSQGETYVFAPDSDRDGIADVNEPNQTAALDPDRDADGLEDGRELEHGSDPADPNSDADRLEDGPEVHDHGSDPTDADTDGDTYSDGTEVARESDPADPASIPTILGPTAGTGLTQGAQIPPCVAVEGFGSCLGFLEQAPLNVIVEIRNGQPVAYQDDDGDGEPDDDERLTP